MTWNNVFLIEKFPTNRLLLLKSYIQAIHIDTTLSPMVQWKTRPLNERKQILEGPGDTPIFHWTMIMEGRVLHTAWICFLHLFEATMQCDSHLAYLWNAVDFRWNLHWTNMPELSEFWMTHVPFWNISSFYHLYHVFHLDDIYHNHHNHNNL